MNYKRLWIVSIIVLLIVIIVFSVYGYIKPIKENQYFDNTSKDSLNKMLEMVEKYEEEMIDRNLGDTNYSGSDSIALNASYERSDFDNYKEKDDIHLRSLECEYLWIVRETLKEAKKIGYKCWTYKEGDLCENLLNKGQIALFMEGEKIFINFYKRDKINFMWEHRDDYINYEVYLEMVDEKLHITLGIDTYNMLSTDDITHLTYYFVEDEYEEYFVYFKEYSIYKYCFKNFESEDYFAYTAIGTQYIITRYLKSIGELVIYQYHPTHEGLNSFVYEQYDKKRLMFSYSEDDYTRIEFSLMDVEGWDSLVQVESLIYDIYYQDELVTIEETTYIDYYNILAPIFSIFLSDGVVDEGMVSLGNYNFVSNYSLSEVLDLKSYYQDNTEDILLLYGLSISGSDNKSFIVENIINHDDKEVIDKAFK